MTDYRGGPPYQVVRPDPFERAVDRADDERRRQRQARRDRRNRRAFRIHAASFVAAQVFLVLTWFVTRSNGGTHYPWFVFPLAGWTILLVAHYAAIAEAYRRPRRADD